VLGKTGGGKRNRGRLTDVCRGEGGAEPRELYGIDENGYIVLWEKKKRGLANNADRSRIQNYGLEIDDRWDVRKPAITGREKDYRKDFTNGELT